MSKSPTILITGASRGIGLELVKQYATDGWSVLACCRDPENAKNLQEIVANFSSVRIFKLDVTDQVQIRELSEKLRGETLEILINNAGIFGGKQQFGSTSAKTFQEVFLTNTFSPLKMIEAFVDHLDRGIFKAIVTISSIRGSIAKNDSTNSYAYNASKAAVNMVMKCVALDLNKRGFTILTLDPGWVRTDMGGNNAPLSVQESVREMKKVITNNIGSAGSFLSFKGEEIPW